MSNVAPIKNEEVIVAHNSHNEFMVVKNSLYPKAPDDMVKLYLEYCAARKFDPFGKAVYLIERKDKRSDESKWEIQPGVGAYRIQAVRSGEYAGLSDVIYGPTRKLLYAKEYNGKKNQMTIEYPEWAEVTIKRIVKGIICEFSSGKRFWKEEYARFKNGNPMDMWEKMPFSQLAKCAEAQALRKAFPDCVDQGASAEELEGKPLLEHHEPQKVKEKEISINKEKISNETLTELRFLITAIPIEPVKVLAWLTKSGVEKLEMLSEETGIALVKKYNIEFEKMKHELEMQNTQWEEIKEETTEPEAAH